MISINDYNQLCKVQIKNDNTYIWSPIIQIGDVSKIYDLNEIKCIRLFNGNNLNFNTCFNGIDFSNINKVSFSKNLGNLISTINNFSQESFIEMFMGAKNFDPNKFNDTSNKPFTNNSILAFARSGNIKDANILNMFYDEFANISTENKSVYNDEALNDIFKIFNKMSFDDVENKTTDKFNVFSALLFRWNIFVSNKYKDIYNEFWDKLKSKDSNVAPESKFKSLEDTYNNYDSSEANITKFKNLVNVYKYLEPYQYTSETNLTAVRSTLLGKYPEYITIVNAVSNDIKKRFLNILTGENNIKQKIEDIKDTRFFKCSDITVSSRITYVNYSSYVNINTNIRNRLESILKFIDEAKQVKINLPFYGGDNKSPFGICKTKLNYYNKENITFYSVLDAQRLYNYLDNVQTNENLICKELFKDYIQGYNFTTLFEEIYGKLYLKAESESYGSNSIEKLENEIRLLNVVDYKSNDSTTGYFNAIETIIRKSEYKSFSKNQIQTLLNKILPEIFNQTFNNLFNKFYSTEENKDLLKNPNYTNLKQDTFYDYLMGIIKSMANWKLNVTNNPPKILDALNYFNDTMLQSRTIKRYADQTKNDSYEEISINEILINEDFENIKNFLSDNFKDYTISNFKSKLNDYCENEAKIYKNKYITGNTKNQLLTEYSKYCGIFTKRLIYNIFNLDNDAKNIETYQINYWAIEENTLNIYSTIKAKLEEANRNAYNTLNKSLKGVSSDVMDMQSQITSITNYLYDWDCYGTNNNDSVEKEIIFDYTLTPIRTLTISIKTEGLISKQQELTTAINTEINKQLTEQDQEKNANEEKTAIENAIKNADSVYSSSTGAFDKWLKEYHTAMNLVNSSYWFKKHKENDYNKIKSDLESSIANKVSGYFSSSNYKSYYNRINNTNYTSISELDTDKSKLDSYYTDMINTRDNCYSCAQYVNNELANYPKATIDSVYTTKRQKILDDLHQAELDDLNQQLEDEKNKNNNSENEED